MLWFFGPLIPLAFVLAGCAFLAVMFVHGLSSRPTHPAVRGIRLGFGSIGVIGLLVLGSLGLKVHAAMSAGPAPTKYSTTSDFAEALISANAPGVTLTTTCVDAPGASGPAVADPVLQGVGAFPGRWGDYTLEAVCADGTVGVYQSYSDGSATTVTFHSVNGVVPSSQQAFTIDGLNQSGVYR